MSKASHGRRRHLRGAASVGAVALAALAATGCGSREPPETRPTPPGEAAAGEQPSGAPEIRVHTVRPGDTLWSLARRYGVGIDEFVAANDLADPDDLSVGQRLVIPDASTVTPSPAGDPSTPAPAPDDDSWAWPVSGGAVLSNFGARRGGSVHRGVDIDAAPGQEVVAAWAGVVVFAGSGMRDYGNAVIIDHGAGLTSLYGHNAELLVSEAQRVSRGQPIARAGDTGNASSVHCHFEVRRYAEALDPMQFLSSATR